MSGRISVCPALTGSAVLNTYNYTFDGIGNRTDRNYAANTANQYKKNPDAANADIDYDPRGNMTTDGVFDFTWNSANQLTSATPKTVVTLEQETTAHEQGNDLPASRKVEFGYDDAGRRIWKKSYVYSSAASAGLANQTRKFVYDGNNRAGRDQPLSAASACSCFNSSIRACDAPCSISQSSPQTTSPKTRKTLIFSQKSGKIPP